MLGAGPTLKPRLEADPLPGDTIRNAATMTAAKVTGATPNSSVFISVLRPRQARVQPAAPAGFANGPAAGLGSGAAGAEPGAAGGGGGGEEAPKLGGIPPGPAWSP